MMELGPITNQITNKLGLNIMKNALIIPVRLESTRLPYKALRTIKGPSIIQRVVNQCVKTGLTTYVVTDNQYIARTVVFNSKKYNNVHVIHDERDADSGTHRIANMVKSLPEDNFINVQGDQPFISPEAILEMSDFMTNNPDCDVVTPVSKHHPDKYDDPSKCKVVRSLSGKAVYFSRNPIPYGSDELWGHHGIYGYKRKVLENYNKLKVSPLEKAERLEQLRFIDNDVPIHTYETEHSIFSVDTMDDFKYATEHCGEFI